MYVSISSEATISIRLIRRIMSIKKILVSQPRPTTQKSPYFDIAAKHNVEIVFRQFIKIEGLTAKEFRHSKINLSDYTAVIFAARHAVDNFFRLCDEMRVTVPDTMKYFCKTEAVAHYLQKYIVYRKRKIFFAPSGKLDDPQLIQSMVKNKDEKFLYPISDVNKDNLSALDANEIPYTKAVMYRTVSNDFTPDEPFDYDLLLFFSPAGIDSLKKNFPDFDQDRDRKYIGTFGAPAAKAVEDAGLRLDFAAPTPEALSMPAALDAFLTRQAEAETEVTE